MAIEVVNWNDLEYETREKGVRFRVDRAAISDRLGAERLGYHASVLPPGKADGPRRFHLVNERMVLVLGGRPTLRLGTGEYPLSPGDVACLPPLASPRPPGSSSIEATVPPTCSTPGRWAGGR